MESILSTVGLHVPGYSATESIYEFVGNYTSFSTESPPTNQQLSEDSLNTQLQVIVDETMEGTVRNNIGFFFDNFKSLKKFDDDISDDDNISDDVLSAYSKLYAYKYNPEICGDESTTDSLRSKSGLNSPIDFMCKHIDDAFENLQNLIFNIIRIAKRETDPSLDVLCTGPMKPEVRDVLEKFTKQQLDPGTPQLIKSAIEFVPIGNHTCVIPFSSTNSDSTQITDYKMKVIDTGKLGFLEHIIPILNDKVTEGKSQSDLEQLLKSEYSKYKSS